MIEMLLDETRQLVRQLDEVPVREHETARRLAIEAALVAPLRVLLQRSIEITTRTFEMYIGLGTERHALVLNQTSQTLDGLVVEAGGADHVADVAFMGCWELRQKHQGLHEDIEDSFENISRCESARRRSVKALCAVELSICEYEGRDSQLAARYRTELANALTLRRAFCSFRRQVTAILSREGAAGQIRELGGALTQLIYGDGYLFTRADDRRHLQLIRHRAQHWLRQKPGNAQIAQSIMDDAQRLVECLRAINCRVELREHDRNLARRVFHAFFAEPLITMPTDALTQLRPLQGRDDVIDWLLAQGPQPAHPWPPLLLKLMDDAPETEPKTWATSRQIYLRGRAAQ